MGKIGIHVTPGDWVPHVADSAPVSLIGLARERLAGANTEPALKPAPVATRRDRAIDKVLAWLSYYALVFVAFAIFMPGVTMEAIAGVREVVGPAVHDRPSDWRLRGSAGL